MNLDFKGENGHLLSRRWSDFQFSHAGVSINGDTPIAGWCIMENPIKMDDKWATPKI